MGRDIFFGVGRYQPQSKEGRRLLAHELVHVAQWKRGGRARSAAPVTSPRRQRLESEASAGADRILSGGHAGPLSSLRHATPLLHPVYISRHGTPGFLQNAFNTFQSWGYTPITSNVDSLQDIVADLATRSAVGRVTIVSHAHPTNVMMALLRGGRPHLMKDDMAALTVPRTGTIGPTATAPPSVAVPGILPSTPTARTTQNFDALVARESDQTHLVPETQLNALLTALAADRLGAARLRQVGQSTGAVVRQYVWWTLDGLSVPHGGYAAGRAARLHAITERARESYRGTIQVAAASAPHLISDRDFAQLDAEIHRLTSASTWQWAGAGNAAARQAAEQRAVSSPYAAVNAILWNPDFLPELAGADRRVRTMWERLPRIENHYLSQSTLNSVITALGSGVLTPLGGPNDHLARQWVWWVIEGEFARIQGFATLQRTRIEGAATVRRRAYRDLIIAALQAAGGQAPAQAVFNAAATSVRQTFSTFALGNTPTSQEQAQIATQLRQSTQVTDLTGNPEFLRQLEFVRAAITANTWFEIQGCRAGQDMGYLQAFRDLFANTRARPKVSAPDWFQSFGHYGFQTVTDAQVPTRWGQPHIQAAFAYWQPILTQSPPISAPSHQDLLAFLRTPMALPQISPNNTTHNTLLVHHSVGEQAMLSWLGRHGYRLTAAQDIRQALFQSQHLAANVRGSWVDWLAEQRQGGEVRFRPDPDYNTHIKAVT